MKKVISKHLFYIERKYFYNIHNIDNVNKIIKDYFFIEEKIDKIIDKTELKEFNKLNFNEVEIKKDESINNNINICDYKMKYLVNKYICNFISSSKYYVHLCIYYIYNNEKKKFEELLETFDNYCFSYEDSFILFYLICKINYKNNHIIFNILNIFEKEYFKIDNFFSYPISNLFFSKYNNLYDAINHLPLYYKIKLINIDKYSKKNNCLNYIDENFKNNKSVLFDSFKEKNVINNITYNINKNVINANEINNKINNEINNKINNKMNNEIKIEETKKKEKKKLSDNKYLEKMNEYNSENILENLQDVDMEKYEKNITEKLGVKFIKINKKKEKEKIKKRENQYIGLKLKNSLINQIKNNIENNMNKNVKYNEILTIFINDEKLIEKNYYMKDFVNNLIKKILNSYIYNFNINSNNLNNNNNINNFNNNNNINNLNNNNNLNNLNNNINSISNNLIILLIFMNKLNYYNNKELNNVIEKILLNNIKRMNIFINDNNIDNIKIYEIIHQEYIYNFELYNENYILNMYDVKVLKTFYYLICLLLKTSFIKYYILKSYLNLFNILLNSIKTNIYKYFSYNEISFICLCFLDKKIIDNDIINYFLVLLNLKLENNFKNLYSLKDKKLKEIQINESNKHNENNKYNETIDDSLHINDVLIFIQLIYVYNINSKKLYTKLLILSFNYLFFLNNTQKLILFNCIEGIKRKNDQNYQNILKYFSYEKNLELFLNHNQNIEKDSLGYL